MMRILGARAQGAPRGIQRLYTTHTPAAPPAPAEPSGVLGLFSRLYVRPAMLVTKGVATAGNNLIYGMQILAANLRDGKVRRRADIWHLIRVKHDMVAVAPFLLYLPGALFLPTAPIVFQRLPRIVPTTFHTAQVLSFKLDGESRTRAAAHAPLVAALSDAVAQRVPSDAPLAVLWTRIQDPGDLGKPLRTYDSLARLASLAIGAPGIPPVAPLEHAKLARLLAKAAGIAAPSVLPRTRFMAWADWVLKDDALIREEGVSTLSQYELLEALSLRGFASLTVDTPMADLQRLLTAHLRFTKALSAEFVRLRQQALAADGKFSAAEKQLLRYTHALTPIEICAAGTWILLARALSINR